MVEPTEKADSDSIVESPNVMDRERSIQMNFRSWATLILVVSACAGDTATRSASSSIATLADFCAKCAQCVGKSGFAEGFCSPFIEPNGSFDRLACSRDGDPRELKNQDLSVTDLAAFSCQQFDDAE